MTEANGARQEVGQRVRSLRKKRGLTLQQVSDRAGLAVSTLSKIERGLLAPAYDKFSKIAAALSVEINALYADDGGRFEEGGFLVARVGESTLQKNDLYTYELLFAESHGKTMLPALCNLKPLEEMNVSEHVRHPGQEFVYVLEGKLELHLDGKLPVILGVGDSAYFDSNRGHVYASATADGARVLLMHAPLQTVFKDP